MPGSIAFSLSKIHSPSRVLVFVLSLGLYISFSAPILSQTGNRLQNVPDKSPLAGHVVYTNSFALLVGINRYEHIPQDQRPQFARKNVLALREILIRNYGFLPENIITLLDEQATRENIQNALAYLADKKRVLPTDRLLMYFSCNGQTIRTSDGGKEGFLIPSDARVDLRDISKRIPYYRFALPIRDLWAYVESSPARHCLVVADACFGGLQARSKGAKDLGEKDIKKLLQEPAYQILTAGGLNEALWEDPALGHSVLAHSLIKELEKRAHEANTTFTLADLFVPVRDEVIEQSKGKQKPLLQSHGGSKGEMVFVTTEAHTVPPLVTGLPQLEKIEKPAKARSSELVTEGIACYESKEYEKAENLFSQALVLDTKNADAYFQKGRLYDSIKKDYVEAERFYKKAIETDSDNSDACQNLGILNTIRKNYPEAERLFKKVIEVEPDKSAAYAYLGRIYYQKDNYSKAEKLFSKVIEIDPANSIAYAYLGRVYYKNGNYSEAERLYKTAIELDANNSMAYTFLGLLGEKKKNYSEAERYYKEAIAHNPASSTAYISLGILYHKKNNNSEAEKLFQKVIALDPHNSMAYTYMGLLNCDVKKNYSEAKRLYKKAIEIDPNNFLAYNALGALNIIKNNYSEAERLYKIVIKLNPNDANFHASLAYVLLRRGKRKEAIQEAKRAKNLGLKAHPVFKELGL